MLTFISENEVIKNQENVWHICNPAAFLTQNMKSYFQPLEKSSYTDEIKE